MWTMIDAFAAIIVAYAVIAGTDVRVSFFKFLEELLHFYTRKFGGKR